MLSEAGTLIRHGGQLIDSFFHADQLIHFPLSIGVRAFLEFCDQHALRADFVSTHHYRNDRLWSPAQDTESELAGGRRGILRQWAAACRQQAGGRPLLYTEWNASSNPRYPRQDEPYA